MNGRINISTCALSTLLLLVCAFSIASAQENKRDSDLLLYCGIDAVYAASRVLGTDVDYASLVKPEFISQFGGSTDADLAKAARFAGLQTTRFDGLSIADLPSLPTPAILHVRSSSDRKVPNHWTLLVRVEAGVAEFVDAGQWPARMPLGDLGAFFDGSSLVVTKKDTPPVAFVSMTRVMRYTLLTLVGASLLVGLCLTPAGGWRGLGLILLTTLGLGLFMSYTLPGGALASTQSTRERMTEARAGALPRVSVANLFQDDLSMDAVLIDARLPGDFARGAIPTAINISPFLNADQLGSAIKRLDKRAAFVMYCQTPGCNYADRVGRELVKRGFDSVSVLAEGFVGYQQAKRSATSQYGDTQ